MTLWHVHNWLCQAKLNVPFVCADVVNFFSSEVVVHQQIYIVVDHLPRVGVQGSYMCNFNVRFSNGDDMENILDEA